MANPALKPADYEDILNLPEHLVGEIINSRLEVQPRPSPKHALASSSLGIEIGSLFHGLSGREDGWWIIDEPELHLGGHILVPDLAGWRKQSLPKLPETAWFETIPDWVCEILSPSTAKIDRSEKMPIYAGLGLPFLWLIDPILQTLEAYQLIEGHWMLLQSLKDSDPVSAPPFASHTFQLSNLWE
ncbi:Uma2 family endonuclease [Methylomonas sp. SURF-2]|uniref:Uma2 family endonuclease n=1 Tax=Methylomonas subterranea TaxID=2952225 RepID=A0ABT1TJ78_9GAMM|nr:Uma2 family endonuclease [Methylomonas sp. SURF-2]MCQ8105495.1 Uma2 family endonuclease [Methylomonas sp. SURF-2]